MFFQCSTGITVARTWLVAIEAKASWHIRTHCKGWCLAGDLAESKIQRIHQRPREGRRRSCTPCHNPRFEGLSWVGCWYPLWITIDVLLYSYVEKYREDAPRFKEWFGHPDPKRWERLRTLFQDMDKHIRHGVYVYDPHGNDDNAIATAGVDPRKWGLFFVYLNWR